MLNRTLNDWLEFISSVHANEIDLGLDRVLTVFNRLVENCKGEERRKFFLRPKKIITVAGTNGKGSTIALMEAGLLACGYTVGTYTSPHICSYNERIHFNGSQIKDEQLVESFQRINDLRVDIPLTYFEFGTLAALDVLLFSNLDVVILEVGLGGRLDAVNIIDADLSIITSVDIDHTDWLGDSIEKIGVEKAGILRKNMHFLAGESLPESVFTRSRSLSCYQKEYHKDFGIEDDRGVFLSLDNKKYYFGELPKLRIPKNNIMLALQAIAWCWSVLPAKKEVIKTNFDWPLIKTAFEQTAIPGRLEIVKGFNNVFLDVGHNAHAATFLMTFLKSLVIQGKKIQVVYSSLLDKDVDAIVEVLSPVVSAWFIAPLECDRAMPLSELEQKVGGKVKTMVSFPSVVKAIESAISKQTVMLNETRIENDSLVTLVFGSFYIIETAKTYFEGL